MGDAVADTESRLNKWQPLLVAILVVICLAFFKCW